MLLCLLNSTGHCVVEPCFQTRRALSQSWITNSNNTLSSTSLISRDNNSCTANDINYMLNQLEISITNASGVY